MLAKCQVCCNNGENISPPQLGDWFVLYQLCKNCNPYFFREFIKELARELKRKPKETKKTSKDSSSGEPSIKDALISYQQVLLHLGWIVQERWREHSTRRGQATPTNLSQMPQASPAAFSQSVSSGWKLRIPTLLKPTILRSRLRTGQPRKMRAGTKWRRKRRREWATWAEGTVTRRPSRYHDYI